VLHVEAAAGDSRHSLHHRDPRGAPRNGRRGAESRGAESPLRPEVTTATGDKGGEEEEGSSMSVPVSSVSSCPLRPSGSQRPLDPWTHTHSNSRTHTLTRSRTHTLTRSRTHTLTHTHTHTRTHTHTHTHTRTHTLAHTLTRTHTLTTFTSLSSRRRDDTRRVGLP